MPNYNEDQSEDEFLMDDDELVAAEYDAKPVYQGPRVDRILDYRIREDLGKSFFIIFHRYANVLKTKRILLQIWRTSSFTSSGLACRSITPHGRRQRAYMPVRAV